jgi:hypothetical protein
MSARFLSGKSQVATSYSRDFSHFWISGQAGIDILRMCIYPIIGVLQLRLGMVVFDYHRLQPVKCYGWFPFRVVKCGCPRPSFSQNVGPNVVMIHSQLAPAGAVKWRFLKTEDLQVTIGFNTDLVLPPWLRKRNIWHTAGLWESLRIFWKEKNDVWMKPKPGSEKQPVICLMNGFVWKDAATARVPLNP